MSTTPPVPNDRPLIRQATRLAHLSLITLIAGTAQASGEFRVRAYTVPAPLNWSDSIELSGRYQTPTGPQGATIDFSVSRAQQALTGRLYDPRHQLQGNLRRTLAPETDATTGTLSYTHIPTPIPTGPALTSVTAYTTFSRFRTPSYQTLTGTAGLTGSARLREGLTASLNASTTATQVPGHNDPNWSAAASASLTYAQGDTSGYLIPSVATQSGRTTYSVTAGGNLPLSSSLSLTGTGTLTASAPPSLTATLTSRRAPLNLSLTAGYAASGATLGGAARLNRDDFSVGAALNVALNNRTPQIQLDATRRAGPLTFAVGAALTDPANQRILNLRGTVTANRAPWSGSLNVNYNHLPTGDTGSATGTLIYSTPRYATTAALALALNRRPGQPTLVTGTADLSATAFISPQLGVSGNARYERSTTPGAPPLYRVGLGITYRFDQEESK